MPHGVDLLPCLERVRSAQNAEESTSCTLSTKIEPDSRGTRPGMTIVGLAEVNGLLRLGEVHVEAEAELIFGQACRRQRHRVGTMDHRDRGIVEGAIARRLHDIGGE